MKKLSINFFIKTTTLKIKKGSVRKWISREFKIQYFRNRESRFKNLKKYRILWEKASINQKVFKNRKLQAYKKLTLVTQKAESKVRINLIKRIKNLFKISEEIQTKILAKSNKYKKKRIKGASRTFKIKLSDKKLVNLNF